MKSPRWTLVLLGLIWALWIPLAHAQTGCALNPKTVTINQTLGASTIDVGLVVLIWCGTASGSSKNISGTLTGPGSTGNLTRSGGTQTVGYSVFRGTGVVSSAPATPTSCNGMTSWTAAVNFSVTVPSGSRISPVQRYMTMCIRIAAAGTQPPGSYLASPIVTVSPFQTGALFASGIDGTQTINITGTIPGTCSIQSGPGNITLIYPSFSTSAITQSTTAGIVCSSGLPWSAALSPTSGTLRGVAYSLTLNNGIQPTFSGTGTGSTQILNITATAAAGQAGTAATCTAPCSTAHSLTLTY